MFEKIIGFINRVKAAITAGTKLKKEDAKMLMDILEKSIEREKIYLYAILSLLGRSKPKESELIRFEKIVNKATDNILDNQEPFSEKDKIEINEFFKSIGLGEKQAHNFILHFTAIRGEIVGEGLKDLKRGFNKAQSKEKV